MLEDPGRRWELKGLNRVVREDLIRAAEQKQDALKPEHFQIFSPGQSVSMLEHHSNKITLSLASQPDGSPLVLIYHSLGEI